MAKIPKFTGIDIGNNSVKICQSTKKGNSFELKAAYASPVNASMLLDESSEGIKNTAETVKSVFKASGSKYRDAVVSVPESSVFSRLLSIPVIENDNELDEAIPWALKSLIPIPLEDVSISFIKINEYQKDNQTIEDWYTVAAPLALVEKYQRIAELSGLKLIAIETEVLAAARAVHNSFAENTDVLIVDIGFDNTNLILSKKTGPIFSQTFGTASETFTKAIETDYGIDSNQAEQYKISFGLDFQKGEGRIANSLKPIADVLIEEINRTLNYYSTKLKGNSLQKIYLTGGGSSLQGLATYIQNSIKIDTEVSYLFSNFQKNSLVNTISSNIDFPKFAVGIGLSLKGSTYF